MKDFFRTIWNGLKFWGRETPGLIALGIYIGGIVLAIFAAGFAVKLLVGVLVPRVGAEAAVRIDVSPRVLLENQQATVVCFVPKAVNNRWLDIGILDVSGSGRQLNGHKEQQTAYMMNFKALPCGDLVAFCDLATADKSGPHSIRVTKQITVGGCN